MERLDDWNPLTFWFKSWAIRSEIRCIDDYLQPAERIALRHEAPVFPSPGRKKGPVDG